MRWPWNRRPAKITEQRWLYRPYPILEAWEEVTVCEWTESHVLVKRPSLGELKWVPRSHIQPLAPVIPPGVESPDPIIAWLESELAKPKK